MPRNLVRRESHHLYADVPANELQQDVLHAVLELLRVAELEVERARAASGLSHNEFMALRYLLQSQREGRIASPSTLAIMLDVSTASVTNIVDHLERAGDVRRVTHPTDRRARLLLPTAEGAAKIQASYGAFHEALVDVVRGADVADQRGLERIAQAIVGRVQRDWPERLDSPDGAADAPIVDSLN
jgi:DNA-binding MarR family transcriptional regulator